MSEKQRSNNMVRPVFSLPNFGHIGQLHSLGKIDYENTFSMHNPNNMNGDINLFNKKTRDLLNKLILIAYKRNGSDRVYYATGEEHLGTKKVYAMV